MCTRRDLLYESSDTIDANPHTTEINEPQRNIGLFDCSHNSVESKASLFFTKEFVYILNANVILYITSKSLRLLRSCYKLLTRNKIIFPLSIITQYFLNIIIKIRIIVIYIFSLVIEQRVLRVFLGVQTIFNILDEPYFIYVFNIYIRLISNLMKLFLKLSCGTNIQCTRYAIKMKHGLRNDN